MLLGRQQVGHVQGGGTSQELHEVPVVHGVEGLRANPRQQHPHLTDVVEGQHLGPPAREGEDQPRGCTSRAFTRPHCRLGVGMGAGASLAPL